MSHGNSVSVILVSLAANVGIAVAKFIGAAISGSAALLAEAIHSLADCGNQLLLLIGNRAAARPPTASHPLGYGRESFFWSFVVALILFSMGGLFSVYDGIHKLSSHEPVQHAWLGLIILGVAVSLEGYSFYNCLREIRGHNSHGSLRQWIRKTTRADLLVIFLEDAAALIGLSLATIALLAAWLTGNSAWDAAGSIAVGVLLIVTAFVLGRETKSLLIGEAPAELLEGPVAEIIAQVIPGAQVIRFVAVQVGSSEVMVAYKVQPPAELTEVSRLIGLLNEAERRVRERFPEIRWQFAEPDNEP